MDQHTEGKWLFHSTKHGSKTWNSHVDYRSWTELCFMSPEINAMPLVNTLCNMDIYTRHLCFAGAADP